MSRQRYVFVGLPATGKTTYLVALYDAVKDSPASKLRVEKIFEGGRHYIEARRQEWLQCRPLTRTPQTPEQIDLTLREVGTSTVHMISIPDIDGEAFRGLVDEHEIRSDIKQLVSDAEGVLFFVNPSKVEENPAIDELGYEPADSGSSAAESEPVWKPEYASPQVKFVVILQLLREWTTRDRLRIGLVVSALDVLDGGPDENKPAQYLKSRLPLLSQYLKSNSDFFEWATFGVSGQGGDYKKDEQRLLEHASAADRVRVVVNDEQAPTQDITAPLRWLFTGIR